MNSSTAITMSDLYGEDVEWVCGTYTPDKKYFTIRYTPRSQKQLEIRALNRELTHFFNGTVPKSNTSAFNKTF